MTQDAARGPWDAGEVSQMLFSAAQRQRTREQMSAGDWKRQRTRTGRQAQMGAAVVLTAQNDDVLGDRQFREPRSRVDDGGAQLVLVVAEDARHSGRARCESRQTIT